MAATEKWVVNASPLICLGKLGHLDWLGRLAAEFVIPSGVATEIETGPADDGPASGCLLSVLPVSALLAKFPWRLPGGIWVAAKAKCSHGHARIRAMLRSWMPRCASLCRRFNMPVCGTVGILMRAKRQRLINSLAAALDDATKAGLYVSPAVRREALRLLGE